MEFQLQYQSFQCTLRTDLLYKGLVGSPCSPRDSQESSPTPQFKSINSSALSFLYGPTLTSMHDHWKNHSFDCCCAAKSLQSCPTLCDPIDGGPPGSSVPGILQARTRWTFVGKVMSLLFNMLSRLVIAFHPRSKHLLISWLQSPSAAILEPKKIKFVTVSIVSPSIFHEVMDWMP